MLMDGDREFYEKFRELAGQLLLWWRGSLGLGLSGRVSLGLGLGGRLSLGRRVRLVRRIRWAVLCRRIHGLAKARLVMVIALNNLTPACRVDATCFFGGLQRSGRLIDAATVGKFVTRRARSVLVGSLAAAASGLEAASDA